MHEYGHFPLLTEVLIAEDLKVVAEKKYSSVLGWDSPFEILCKLERDKERMQEAKTLHDFVDHTMNFTLTAYHMIDWVWSVVQRNPTDASDRFERDSWIAAIGFIPKKHEELLNWARAECPELEYCRQLANATKHLSCRLKDAASGVEFEVAPTLEWTRKQQEAPYASILDQHLAKNWRLVLVESGNEVDLSEVRDRVFGFWEDHSYRIYIGAE